MRLSVASIRSVLFVCTGNICRSPMAEGLLRKILQEKPVQGIEVSSAGFIALPGNPASFHAVRVAQENGFDLEDHQARLLTPRLVQEADLILVMEPYHRLQLLRSHPEASHKVLLLRQFARYGSRDRAIQDPYGLNIEAYRFCFQDIRECVESLHEWLLDAKQTTANDEP